MKNKQIDAQYHKSKGIFMNRELLQSFAYRCLSERHRDIFHIFLLKRVYNNKKHWHKQGKVVVNNGKITFCRKEARKRLGIAKSTFWAGIGRLIEVGLIEIEKQGCDNHANEYHICYDDGKNKWMQYPHVNWKRDKKDTIVGRKTRFKSNSTPKHQTVSTQNEGKGGTIHQTVKNGVNEVKSNKKRRLDK